MQKATLNRNLRRNILRGHPWVYKEALKSYPKGDKAEACQVLDPKGEPLAWAFYDPHCPLALRIIGLERKPPILERRFERALQLRKNLSSNGFRLFNGEGDLLPGLVCDIYDQIAVVQFDGPGPREFWQPERVTQWLVENANCHTVIEKSRMSEPSLLHGEKFEKTIVIEENGVKFKVDLEKGQKTGFFFDQRDNRDYVRQTSEGKTLLNLFSYSGGFSVYAGVGGAKEVTSVDIAQGAIDLANENWQLNEIENSHNGICADVFDFLAQEKNKWDSIVVDPPSMAHSEDQREKAITKYTDVFAEAAKRVKKGGNLFLSSCSSHVSFEDFFEITNQALSKARTKGQILRVSGQGLDHPFPHVCHELRYLKFVHLVLG